MIYSRLLMRVAASVVNARRERLAHRISTEGYLPLADLCKDLGVSLATARRDLAHLQSKGRIARIRGGALPRERTGEVHDRPARPVRAETDSIATLFESGGATALKKEICEMGRRCWIRGFIEGSSGNFSARLGDYFLSTPTGVSKGFMRPEMICLVDGDGRQVAAHGNWQRTEEIHSHLAIYHSVPMAASVAHAHPVHATAFSVSGIEPPRGLLPEVELFASPIVRADYRMPGSADLSIIIGKLAPGHQSILLRNHGLICWGATIEDAYFKLEISEAYCRTVAVAAQLPGRQTAIPADEMKSLLDLKRRLGIPDARLNT